MWMRNAAMAWEHRPFGEGHVRGVTALVCILAIKRYVPSQSLLRATIGSLGRCRCRCPVVLRLPLSDVGLCCGCVAQTILWRPRPHHPDMEFGGHVSDGDGAGCCWSQLPHHVQGALDCFAWLRWRALVLPPQPLSQT